MLRLGGGGPGTLKLCNGWPWPRGAFGTSIAKPGAYVMLGLLKSFKFNDFVVYFVRTIHPLNSCEKYLSIYLPII